ncbi:MAG: VWA domain-containing protein, partial [Bacteroidales bacterium]|nr:VWA domain-containing protein [Bacteroidales bacterium]
LSRSMLAEDIQPNRIERAKLKIRDLFEAQPGIRTALVAYAGTAHTVVPFTKDYRTISQQLEALTPEIMPLQGTNITEALNLSDSLLSTVIAPSTILLVTDQVKPSDVERIRLSSRDAAVGVMVIGTPGGAPIPYRGGFHRDHSGNRVIASFDPIVLSELGQSEKVNIVTVTLDDSDVKILAASIRSNLEFIADPDQAETDWKDAGYWLLLPLLLISLFWFRRGWMVHWCWLIIFLTSCSGEGDFRVADLFLTRDQQGQSLIEKDKMELASERFESGEWKGYTYAEMGQFEEAAIAYSHEANATGFYNLGVVYARMGNAEAARQAFNAALELDPELDQARRNLEIVDTVIDSVNRTRGISGDQIPDEK